jgi:TorA maturation chaperone TorD
MDILTGLLEARAIAYALFQKLTGNEPDDQLLGVFFSEETRTVFDLFNNEGSQSYANGVRAYIACSKAYHVDPEAFLSKAKSEYTKNFLGPDHLIAPPWESVVTSKDHLLLQESTLQVRRFYASEGFRADLYPSVADDHLAYELDFVKRLAELCRDARSSSDEVEFKRLIDRQAAFLDLHLLRWIEPYTALIQESKSHVLYPQLAVLLYAYLRIDRKLLEDMGARSAEPELPIR